MMMVSVRRPAMLSLAVLLCLAFAGMAFATTYYVDSAGGNDGNLGTSQTAAWQNLTKVNTVTFQPGDQILLKCGSVWNGQFLYPKGSGASGNPIIINSYGTGAKPLINNNLVYNVTLATIPTSVAVFLYNQAYWEINNLEVTNTGTPSNDVHGIYITAEETGQVYNHVYIKSCYVHDISSRIGRGTGRDHGKNNAAICFDVYGATVAGTMFNDLLVDSCTIANCGTGVKTWSDQFEYQCHTPCNYNTNVMVKNCVVDHTAGDGIVLSMVNTGRIEYCTVSNAHWGTTDAYVAIWNYEANDITMQFNEAYLTQTETDGQGFDIDDYTERTIVQYNYSHDNVGGFILIIGTPQARGKCGSCDNNVIRYNISQNDGAEIVKFAGEPHHSDFYNNTIYHSGGAGTPPATTVFRLSVSYYTHAYNNIFDTWFGGSWLQPDFQNSPDFRHNVIYGTADYAKWVSVYPDNQWGVDPGLVNPGTGGTGRATCGGYYLQAGSPCINAGLWSDAAELMALGGHPGPIGANHGTQDYFGNALGYPAGSPDVGAYESNGGSGGNPPVANFTGNPTSGTAPLTVMFTDSSSNNPTSWAWTFGDGGTSTAQNPSHVYSAGTYTVALTATNAYGNNTNTKTNYITASAGGNPPVAQFVGSPASGTAPLAVTFSDQSTDSPTGWSWTFGDGGTSTAQNPSHTYAVGTYTVALTATNQYGNNTNTKTNYITASAGGNPPVANFAGNPTSGVAPLAVTFADTSTNSPTAWSWAFGDGGTSTAQNPSHTYAAGTYTVALTATNQYGNNTNTKTNYITASSGGGGGDFSCTAAAIETGTSVSGDHTSTHVSDNVYWRIAAVKNGGNRNVQVAYTFETGLGSLSSLTLTLESHPTLQPQRQRIYLWDYTTNNWSGVLSDLTLTSTSDQTTVIPISSPATYRSSTGQVKVRVRTGDQTANAWDHYLDLVKITAQP